MENTFTLTSTIVLAIGVFTLFGSVLVGYIEHKERNKW